MKSMSDIINDNDRYDRKSAIVIESKKLDITEAQVDKIADWIQFELGTGEESRAFYCKIARYFPRGYLAGVVARAKKQGRHPNKLFCFLMKRELARRKVR